MKVLPDLILSWPKEVRGKSGFWVLFALGLAALEVLGRFAENDFEDGLAAICLGLLFSALLFRDGRRSRRLLIAAKNRFQTKALRVAQKWCDLEADLRRQPELERGLPPGQWKPTAILLAAVPVLYAYALWVPVDLRTGISDIFYVGYLSLLLVLWTLMVGCAGVALLFSLTLLREYENQRGAAKSKVPSWIAPAFLLMIAFVGFVLVPTVAPLVSAVAWLATMAMLLLPGGPKLDFAWKKTEEGEGASRCVADWSWFLALHSTILVAVPLVVALLGSGHILLRGWDSQVFPVMPVTSFFGMILAWVAATTSVLWCSVVVRMVLPGRRHNPANAHPPSLRCVVEPGLKVADAEKALDKLGMKFRVDGADRREDEVEFVLSSAAEDFQFQESWPLRVSLEDCANPKLRERLLRRSQILRRRSFFRSLEKLWKSVPQAQLESGEGVLLAPHHWFSPGLTRDEGRERVGDDKLTWRSQTLGPEYRKAMPIGARRHFYEVMQALEIDIIYVERGVKYRHLRRALRIMFDVYDMHGGKRGLSERDLSGVPGMRAILHVFDFDEPFASKVYPEPHYDGVGRARVLHLFRDRGDDEVRVEDPSQQWGRPVPLLLG
ncbi:MAG: hypothetical protein V3W41_07130 [Planctomycetota bacterium]